MEDIQSILFPLSAIWTTVTGKTTRIAVNDEITVKYGMIINSPFVTHKVVKCSGTLSDSVLQFELQDLVTDELLTLNI